MRAAISLGLSFFIVLAPMNEAFAVQPLPPASPAAPGPLTITVEPIACVIVGEHSMIDATIAPSANVARVRLYFKSGATNEWFYVETVRITPDEAARQADAGEGTDITAAVFRGWLPEPTVKANPITVYMVATTADLAESRSREITINAVEDECACGGKTARFGDPPEGLTYFNAATGEAVTTRLCCGSRPSKGAIALVFATLGGLATGVVWVVGRIFR
ncbi:MAG TPA: hypothetical protein VGL15_11810 [Vicinamibacteria bacterium]